MAAASIRILMLEDSALDAELILAQLARAGLKVDSHRVWARDPFIDSLVNGHFDIILADHVLPGFDGDTALGLARELAPGIPFIFVSGTLTEELAVQALTRGARDYVVKQRLQRLPDAITRALQERHERHRLASTEQALQENRDRLQLIADAVPAMISHFGLDFRYRFANRAYQEWHGLSAGELLGRSLADVVGSELFAWALPYFQRVLSGERVSFEASLQHHRDGLRHLQVDCMPEIAADGRVTGFTTLASDITGLKRSEQLLRRANGNLEREIEARTAELQTSEMRLQAVFESSFQHQALLGTDGTLLDANVASLAAILASKDEVVGTAFCDSAWFAGTPGARAMVASAVAAATAGHASRHELDLELPTGLRRFDFSFRPLRDHDGTTTAVVWEGVDTTARRDAEHALRQSQKIEAVGQLTGGIAHDFNNILTVIAGNVEHAMLLNERSGTASAPSARALDNALKGVMRASSLTQRLLAFARRQPLRSEAVDLNDRVLGMQDMLQRALGELVRLEINTMPDVWCAELDVSQLEASVLNLAVNARDAMPDGGHLAIEIDNGLLDEDYAAQFPDTAPGQYVMLRVRDSGHGMSTDTLARVFEPFFTTKQVGRGTGLGLSMVHGFVKQSGGHIQVDSREGAGTTITLMFPRSGLPLPDAQRDIPTGLAGFEPHEETILVAEDNDDVRAYTVEALRQLGYRVLEAHDGPTALRLLDRPDVRVDLLFSDVVMPGMSGWELAREVAGRRPGLPVLFTSGYPRDHGASGRNATLLAKPFTRSDLSAAVRSMLEPSAAA
ncbi:response regulator [Stenotrophomonas sp. 24(2023)]|uniref:response regulator n=1 Tax=Stenotrophomonas sp. 24(2023) TaxID=3068324 RepID=UPI0027E0FDE7|nr:response regulator [Stenotrophomonas sp. 24(2023)]WMJ69305.1 response regulator [Stenotrophomonas sp. 24(2023)]